MSKVSGMLDLLDMLRELSWDVKYSSIDLGCEIESKIDEMEKILKSELEIKERSLLAGLKPLQLD